MSKLMIFGGVHLGFSVGSHAKTYDMWWCPSWIFCSHMLKLMTCGGVHLGFSVGSHTKTYDMWWCPSWIYICQIKQ